MVADDSHLSRKRSAWRGRAARCLLTGWCLLLAAPAEAHAVLTQSTPAAEAVVPGPRVEVELRFNSRVDAARSKLVLVAPDGGERRLEILPVDAPNVLRASAEGLDAGAYRLRWQVLSIDGHITRGDVPFVVEGQ
jgi:methionine-rich copper-binding protein CopC